jgi:hypothetical protein
VIATSYSGPLALGYQLATHALGQLAAGTFFTSANSGSVTEATPPAGQCYAAMVITEYNGTSANSGYTRVDSLNFSNTINGKGPPDNTPPAANIASPTEGTISGILAIALNFAN